MIAKLFKMKGQVYDPAGDGFVFSPIKFAMYQRREAHLQEVMVAARHGFNLKKFQSAFGDGRFQPHILS